MHRLLSFLAAILIFGVMQQPAAAAQITVVTAVNVVKPVTLSKIQDLDFGTLTFAGFSGSRTIVMSRAGAVTCAADIVCSGIPVAARFNVQGTNKMVVTITVSASELSNGTDSIAFTPDAPASVTLTNSGAPGSDFEVGGSINVSPSLVGGTYTGTMDVTADHF